MALDGLVLNQIQKELLVLIPSKINKIQQISDTEMLFTIRAQSRNYRLMISCHSVYNRIHFTNRVYTAPDVPQAFTMVLRKHINGAIIKNIEQLGLDRILRFSLEARNELGDIHNILMYVELMGKYANIILVNDENKIIDALKRIPPYENNIRTIHPGATFVPIAPQTNKQNPYNPVKIDYEQSFTQQFHGFSPLLSDEVHYRLQNGEKFNEVMKQVEKSDTIYISKKEEKDYFHLLPLTHLQVKCRKYPLQEAMDTIYFEKEEKVHIKEQSGDLFKVVKQELKKNRTKLIKLEKTLDAAYNLEDYRLFADLLYAYAYQITEKRKEIVLPSFETNEDISIPLDEKLDAKQNAKKYYQRYQKAKTAQIEVAKQIELTKNTITYFENVEAQLEQANFLDACEIREELANLNYMRNRQQRTSRKKKNKPNFLTLKIDDVYLYVGKNNIQNDYITFKQSRKDNLWFHTKDIHGSHVVLNISDPSEKLLRIAALFAAYYSQARNSSSVPVNYCYIRQLKKPNKGPLGFVVLSNYKTIYIDPEEELINDYIEKYQIKN